MMMKQHGRERTRLLIEEVRSAGVACIILDRLDEVTARRPLQRSRGTGPLPPNRIEI